ncbi:MAG: metallophosphoesterase [Polyangiales bacterium]
MTDRLVVVSDVHLAVPGPLNNFHAGDALADFVAAQRVPNTTLVLAGDVFDFLQIPGRPERLRGDEMPALIATTLDALAATPWGERLFAAFGALLRTPGARVVVTPGNHDPEVAHPAFATQLLAKAGLPDGHPGLVVRADGVFRTRVGARDVVVAHGHRTDPWNDIAPATVAAALAGEDAPLPPGSRLVTRVLNAFKDARDDAGAPRFPFVDLLKPELPCVPLLLLYLDRALAMEHLPDVLGLRVETFARSVAKALTGASLGLESAGPAPAPADDVARALAATYSPSQRSNPGRVADELATWLEEGDVGGLEGTLAPHGGMRARMLRAFLRAASDDGRFFDRTHRSEDCVALARAHQPADATPCAVIGGHTHAAREVWLSAEHVYLNTGTWTDLMAFPARLDDEALRTWIDALERREVPRVRHLTWAEVTPSAVGLHSLAPLP